MAAQQSGALPYWRLSSFYFFYFCVLGAMAPYWPSYLDWLGYNAEQIGLITAVVMGTRLLAPNFWGYWADRSDSRLRIVRIGATLACLCFLGVFIQPEFWWLVLVISGYTFFWHAVLPQFDVITLGYLQARPRFYGRIRLWGSLGFTASVVALGSLFDWLPIAYLPWVIVTFLALIVASSLTLHTPPTVPQPRIPGAFWARLKSPYIVCFFIASFLLQLSHGPYYTFYTLYLVDNLGYSRSFAGLMWALGVVAEVLMFFFMPRLLERFSLRLLFMLMLTITCIRWLMIGMGGEFLAILVIAQVLHAWSFAVAHGVSIEIIRGHFDGGTQSQGQALYGALSFGLGGALGALLGGRWWEAAPMLTYLAASGAVALALLVVYFGMKKAHS